MDTVHYMNLVYSVNNQELVEVPITGNTTAVELNSRSSEPIFTVEVYIYNSLQSANRWKDVPHGGASLIVQGARFERGVALEECC
jgi:hypothetical protein